VADSEWAQPALVPFTSAYMGKAAIALLGHFENY